MRVGRGCGPTSYLVGVGLREGVHIGTLCPQPENIEGSTIMLEFFVWGGVLQRLPPTLGVYEKHVFGEPLPVPSLRLGGFTPWMIHQGMVKALTRGGSDASLLAQQLDGQLESLWTAAQVRLATIPSADEALFGLGNFSFVASHLFYVGGGSTCSGSYGAHLSH